MNKRIRIAIAAATIAGGFAMTQGGSASAAHCVSPAPAADSPGFSYFGTVHVKGETHANEGVGRPHDGTPGASNCIDSGSPSDRAPGRQG